MNLPNSEKAVVTPDKLKDYLLSKNHLVGRWKASYFRSIGFNETNVNELKNPLLDVAHSGEVKSTTPSVFGVKYVVKGKILRQMGRMLIFKQNGL